MTLTFEFDLDGGKTNQRASAQVKGQLYGISKIIVQTETRIRPIPLPGPLI